METLDNWSNELCIVESSSLYYWWTASKSSRPIYSEKNSISLSSTLFFVAVSSKRHDLLSTHHSRHWVYKGHTGKLHYIIHLQQRTLVCVKGNVILASSTHEGVHFVWSTYNIFLLLHMPTYYKLLNRIRSGHVDLFWLVMHFNLGGLHIWKSCSAAPSV